MPELLTSLSADLLPHRLWAVSKWFYANPLWYYHRPSTDEEIVVNRRFYQLVDPELRDLCHLLHETGIDTTPSCQGHSYPKERFERIWDELQNEVAQITSQGLIVRDSETDREFLFRDRQFHLPWKTFDEFYHAAGEHQGIGYIGVLIPRNNSHVIDSIKSMAEDEIRIDRDERIGRLLGGELFHVTVHSPDPLVRALSWRKITHSFQALLVSS